MKQAILILHELDWLHVIVNVNIHDLPSNPLQVQQGMRLWFLSEWKVISQFLQMIQMVLESIPHEKLM